MLNIDKLKYAFESYLLTKLEGISCEIPGLEDHFIYNTERKTHRSSADGI